MRRSTTTFLAFALVLPFGVALLVHAAHYWPFLSDDALISLRYAARLLEGKGLTWTEGQPVEGYSNLLWILMAAGLGAFGVDLVTAVRVLGVLCMLGVMLALGYSYGAGQAVRKAWYPIALALTFLALGAPIAVWTIGGLEQPLQALLLAAAIALWYRIADAQTPTYRSIAWFSLPLGLLCLTRPDGPLFVLAAAVSLIFISRSSGLRTAAARVAVAVLVPAGMIAAQLAFRLWYYGELVPNTALVKLAFSTPRLRSGATYLSGGLRALSPFSFIAVVVLLVLPAFGLARRTVYPLLCALLWSSYVVLVGGDIFPAYRHIVPLMVIFAFAIAEGARVAQDRLRQWPRLALTCALAIAALAVPYAKAQFSDRQNQKAIRERWEWEGQEVGLLLKNSFSSQQPLLAVTAAGCLPYWSRLPAVDMLGLNDYYLPRHPPAGFGTGGIGHELGDGKYVLGRRPDIIVFTVGSGPGFRSGEEMNRMPEFHDRYVAVRARTEPSGYMPLIYFDRYSAKTGLQRTAREVRVPGFMLTGDGTVAVRAGDSLVARMPAGAAAAFSFRADGEMWRVASIRASDGGVTGEIRQDGDRIDLTVRTVALREVDIREVVLDRKTP